MNQFIKPAVVLSAICALAGTLLAVTHTVTQPIIEANAIAAANAARAELLPQATGFKENKEVSIEGVTEIYVAEDDAGVIITAQAAGYSGAVPVMVAFDTKGNILAVKFLDNTETPGLGQKVKEKSFGQQFQNKPAQKLKLGSDITAITGATISSNAALNAVNLAVSAYQALEQKGMPEDLTPEQALLKILPDAGTLKNQQVELPGVKAILTGEKYGAIIVIEGKGHTRKPMYAMVGFDDEEEITGIWVNGENEGEPVRQYFSGFSFAQEAVGQKDLSQVDVVAGATISSAHMKQLIQTALDVYHEWKKEIGQ